MLLIVMLAGCPAPDKGAEDTAGGTCDTKNEECGPTNVCGGESATMLPGADCISCHSPGNLPDDKSVAKEESDGEKSWTAAGTVFTDPDGTDGLSGAVVRITDDAGEQIELTTNSAGNFYTTFPFTFPISAEVEVDGDIVEMGTQPDVGSCNGCHKCDGEAGGKLYGP